MGFIAGAGSAAAVAAAAALADWRQTHRTDPDNVGFMPWRGVQAVAFSLALVLLALGLR